jgi:hypothetical protein
MGGKPRAKPATVPDEVARLAADLRHAREYIAELESDVDSLSADLKEAKRPVIAHGELERGGVRIRMTLAGELEVWRDCRFLARVSASPSDHSGPVGELVLAVADLCRGW